MNSLMGRHGFIWIVSLLENQQAEIISANDEHQMELSWLEWVAICGRLSSMGNKNVSVKMFVECYITRHIFSNKPLGND